MKCIFVKFNLFGYRRKIIVDTWTLKSSCPSPISHIPSEYRMIAPENINITPVCPFHPVELHPLLFLSSLPLPPPFPPFVVLLLPLFPLIPLLLRLSRPHSSYHRRCNSRQCIPLVQFIPDQTTCQRAHNRTSEPLARRGL